MNEIKDIQDIAPGTRISWEQARFLSQRFDIKELDIDIREYYEKVKESVPLWFFKLIQFLRNDNLKLDCKIPLINKVPGFHPKIRSLK